MLWINGPPGYGKTILCTRIVQHLSTTPESPVAYYFLSADSENRNPSDIIRSWISQVISVHRDAFELACSRWSGKTGQSASRTDIIELFQEIIRAIPSCTFVVDGLDECASATESWRANDEDSAIGLLRIIKHAIAHTTTRVLIVSRDETGIRSGFHATAGNEPLSLSEFKISSDDVRSDAMSFSRSVVDKKLAKKTEALRDELSRRIVDRCEGMFLWVKMLEDQLRAGKNKKQLEEIVDDTPTALNHLYDRNWMKISSLPDKDKTRAFSILRWTVFSLRPLTILELTEALIIMDDDDCDDLLVDELPDEIDNKFINTEILGLCASLLEIRNMTSTSDLGSMTVQPVHFSAKQYILCSIPLPGILENNNRLRLSNEAIQNNFLAKLCLRYVSFAVVWRDQRPGDTEVTTRPFRDYAAGSWYKHFNRNSLNCGVVKLIDTFFQPENQNWDYWRKWFDSVDKETEFPNEISKTSRLYYASLLGLESTIIGLIGGSELDVNHTDGLNRTAIQAACIKGHIDVVKLLLEKGADVAIATNDGWAPLNSAASNGHIDVIKLLLEKGADVAVPNNNGWTPLNSAADNGHFDVVRLLLEKGADVAAPNKNGWTPLNSAANNGHFDVVRLLLEKGADVAAPNKNGWTPLNSAANNGHSDVVRLLLEKGADMATANNSGWTLLNSAASNGHVDVVKLLLEKGADVTLATNDGWMGSITASDKGHIEVVKLLLDSGADFEAKDTSYGQTPLSWAAENGHEAVVQQQLDKGANIEAKSTRLYDCGRTPLCWAAKNGHEAVVRQLLEKGANIEAKDEYGQTPLSYAAEHGHEAIVQLLLEKSANIDAKDNTKRTTLFFAANNGHERVIILLLTHDKIDSDLKDHYDSTPLSIAARQGHVEVVRLLLDTGSIDINSQDCFGRTPLWFATKYQHSDIAKLLYDYAEKRGISLRSNDLPVETRFRPHDVLSRSCDVCILSILEDEVYYNCGVCNGGNFDICLECYEVGGRCLKDHKLYARKDS